MQEASRKIYAAKGRPSDNPLILHISKLQELGPIVKQIPDRARLLAEAFWPGPLTMILQGNGTLPDIVPAGGASRADAEPHAQAHEGRSQHRRRRRNCRGTLWLFWSNAFVGGGFFVSKSTPGRTV